jgi:hypothetical protein
MVVILVVHGIHHEATDLLYYPSALQLFITLRMPDPVQRRVRDSHRQTPKS